MICPACKSAVADDVRFCLHCGHYLGEPDETTRIGIPRSASIPKGRRSWTVGPGALIIGAIVIFIFGVVVAVAIIGARLNWTKTANANRSAAGNTSTPRTVPTTQPAATPVPSPVRESVVDATFPVRARSYTSHMFTLTRSGRLTGTFNASGGSDDIDVWVIDANQMPNFTHEHNTSFYYRSDYVSYGEINLSLRPGSYYLIFSNRKAWLTNKIVDAHVYSIESGPTP